MSKKTSKKWPYLDFRINVELNFALNLLLGLFFNNLAAKFGNSKPDQKVGSLGGPFGSTSISKSCLRNFQERTPLKMVKKCMLKYGHAHDFLDITWSNINIFEYNLHHFICTNIKCSLQFILITQYMLKCRSEVQKKSKMEKIGHI